MEPYPGNCQGSETASLKPRLGCSRAYAGPGHWVGQGGCPNPPTGLAVAVDYELASFEALESPVPGQTLPAPAAVGRAHWAQLAAEEQPHPEGPMLPFQTFQQCGYPIPIDDAGGNGLPQGRTGSGVTDLDAGLQGSQACLACQAIPRFSFGEVSPQAIPGASSSPIEIIDHDHPERGCPGGGMSLSENHTTLLSHSPAMCGASMLKRRRGWTPCRHGMAS